MHLNPDPNHGNPTPYLTPTLTLTLTLTRTLTLTAASLEADPSLIRVDRVGASGEVYTSGS